MKTQIYFFRLRFYIVTVVTHTKKHTVSLLKNPFVFVSSILKEGSYFCFLYVSMLAFFLVFVFYLPMYYSLAHHRIGGKLLNKKKLDLCFHAVNAIILLILFEFASSKLFRPYALSWKRYCIKIENLSYSILSAQRRLDIES